MENQALNISQFIEHFGRPEKSTQELNRRLHSGTLTDLRRELQPDYLGKMHKAKNVIKVQEQREAVENLVMGFEVRDNRRESQQLKRQKARLISKSVPSKWD